jgi:preprotein translocase subunit SecE
MNTKADTPPSSLDTAKLALALLVLIGGLVAFYYYADAAKLARIGGIVAAVVAAVAIASQTEKGRQMVSFVRDAQIEVRKVVWPTRKETTNTTLVVMIVVILFAFLLWVLDWILGGMVQALIGRGA